MKNTWVVVFFFLLGGFAGGSSLFGTIAIVDGMNDWGLVLIWLSGFGIAGLSFWAAQRYLAAEDSGNNVPEPNADTRHSEDDSSLP